MHRKLESQNLLIASHNAGKISEISALLSQHGIKSLSAASLNLPEPEEDGLTYLENALIKARACMALTNLAVLADDSGIEVAAFGQQPGVDTAPYTKKLGTREKVFALWQADPALKENPRASFVCVQVLMWPDGHFEHFFARVSGRLAFPPRGLGGHGYDPIFIPDGHSSTMAEMNLEEKNSFSHRSRALRSLIANCLAPK